MGAAATQTPRIVPQRPARAVERLKAGGFAPRISTRDRTQLDRRYARSIGANLRRRTEEAKDEVMAINARMARIASEAVGEARQAAVNVRRKLRLLGTAAPRLLEFVDRDLGVTAARSSIRGSRSFQYDRDRCSSALTRHTFTDKGIRHAQLQASDHL